MTESDRLPNPLPIRTTGPFRVAITPPGSKSVTNRALLLAALAQGRSTLHRPLRADDTVVMAQALRALGAPVTAENVGDDATPDEDYEADEGVAEAETRRNSAHRQAWSRIIVEGAGGALDGCATINLANAGTATRFLTAACALARSPVTIDGDDRMRQRPIGELVQMLGQIGAEHIQYLGEPGYVPLRVYPSTLSGGSLTVGRTLSSQFISALLQVGPYCADGLTLNVAAPLTSPSYVRMTLGLMERFGANVQASADMRRIRVEPGGYRGTELEIEPDASSATYFLAAAAIVPGAVSTINGLGKRSLQGDVQFADVLQEMGAGLTFGSDFITVIGPAEGLHGIDIDMSAMPDAAMTLAVAALFARGVTVIRGVGNLRYKETDRLAALKCELEKFGATVEIEDDELMVIEPPGRSTAGPAESAPQIIEVETYDDHRMAMSFAVAGLRRPGVVICNRQCVTKTYPGFWEDWERIYSGEEGPSG